MKYSEAKKILEKNGMELERKGDGYIYIRRNGSTAAIIPEQMMYMSDNFWRNEHINNHQLAIAQKVAYKLSRTKPEDREDEPKKYYLMIPHLPDSLKNVYINKDLDVAGRFLLLDNKETPDCQTLFTDAEIKQMQQDPIFKHVDLEKWKQEPMPF